MSKGTFSDALSAFQNFEISDSIQIERYTEISRPFQVFLSAKTNIGCLCIALK
jgi:hypothetical protein